MAKSSNGLFFKLSFGLALIVALLILMPDTTQAGLQTQATAAPTEPGAPAKQVFVGQVQASQAFIGLTVTGEDITIFVCDGTKTSVSYWHWFTGKVRNGAVDITAADSEHVTAQFSTDTVTGTVTLNDKVAHPFNAVHATGSAGVFRTEFTIDGVDYVGVNSSVKSVQEAILPQVGVVPNKAAA